MILVDLYSPETALAQFVFCRYLHSGCHWSTTRQMKETVNNGSVLFLVWQCGYIALQIHGYNRDALTFILMDHYPFVPLVL